MDDESLMPFGKYKGLRLGDVPDDYLLWFLKQDFCDKYPDLVVYANQIMDDNDEQTLLFD